MRRSGPTDPRQRRIGITLVAASAVLWSTAGLFVRMADLDAWTVLGWRSLFSALFLGAFHLVRPGRFAANGRTAGGLSAGFMVASSTIATICYVFALKLTTVANVMTVYATLPFCAAGVAFLWLGERADARTLMASAMALAGVMVMAGSTERSSDIVGDLLAFVMTAGFGAQLVWARRHPGLDVTLPIAVSAALCAAISWPLMASGVPSLRTLVILAAFGIVTTGIAYLMALDGGRRIGAAEAGFISLLDVVLGPLWVWLAFAERPGNAVLVGGAIVLAAVVWYLAGGLRRDPAALRA